MTGLKTIGQILLWGGFLSGALASVMQIKAEPNAWATINWPWFIASVGVGVAGIVIFRIGRRSSTSEIEKAHSDFATLGPALDRISSAVSKLQIDLPHLAPSEIPKQIDATCVDDLNLFAEGRESIITKKSMADYAAVMTEFAAAERTINRAWSAGADGYLDEVESCLQRASSLLENARALL